MWKNRLFLILCIFICIYYAILYDRYVTLAVLWCMLFVPFGSMLGLFFWKRKVEVKIQTTEEVARMGEELSYSLVVKNNTWFPIMYGNLKVKYKNQLDEEYQNRQLVCRVDGKNEELIQIKFQCNHCGIVKIVCEEIRIYDYLRLFSVKIPFSIKRSVMVIPEFEMMEELQEELMDDRKNMKKVNLEKGEDTSEIIGIREYQPGDHPKRIHWKLSSKKRNILIKEFSMEEDDVEIFHFELVCKEEDYNYSWFDEKMEELVNTCWTLLQVGRSHKVRWFHPQYGTYQTVEINHVEDIGVLAREVMEAGVEQVDKEEVA